MVALVDLWLHQDLLCAAELNWTIYGLQPPSLKNTVGGTVGSCAVASLGDIPRHLSKKSVSTRYRWEAARRWFLLVLQSLCMDLQNSNGKLPNLVFLKKCSILVLKLEILIQNCRALIAV